MFGSEAGYASKASLSARIHALLTLLWRGEDMDMDTVTLKLPREMREVAEQLAEARDVSLGQLLREALTAELRRSMRATARTPNRAEEQLLGPLRVLLAPEFAQSTGWGDLIARLEAKGYALREAGGGLAVHTHPKGARLCKASELGNSYADLMRRFGTPLPGHAHRHLADRLLGRPQAAGAHGAKSDRKTA